MGGNKKQKCTQKRAHAKKNDPPCDSGKQKRGKSKKGGGSVPHDMAKLRNFLGRLGLEISEAQADGNCLFRSVAASFYGCENDYRSLRHKCCQFMLENRGMFECFVHIDEDYRSGALDGEEGWPSFEAYVEEMTQNRTWGTQLELSALCQCLGVACVVFQPDLTTYEINMTASGDPDRVPCIFISYHDGMHFNSVRVKGRDDLPTLAEARLCLLGPTGKTEEPKDVVEAGGWQKTKDKKKKGMTPTDFREEGEENEEKEESRSEHLDVPREPAPQLAAVSVYNCAASEADRAQPGSTTERCEGAPTTKWDVSKQQVAAAEKHKLSRHQRRQLKLQQDQEKALARRLKREQKNRGESGGDPTSPCKADEAADDLAAVRKELNLISV